MKTPPPKRVTMNQYVRALPPAVRGVFEKMRDVIREEMPGAEEAMRYGMPTFRLEEKNLLHVAVWKKHIGVYPMPEGTAAFRAKMARYMSGEATVRFQLDEPVPYELLRMLVRFRVAERF